MSSRAAAARDAGAGRRAERGEFPAGGARRAGSAGAPSRAAAGGGGGGVPRWRRGGGRGGPPSGPNQCHDITVYPDIGLAGGACGGYGLLLDIREAAHPIRIDAAADINMSFWHSATFSNDGTKVLFTDEWGGGTQPRCRDTDKHEWGANALFTIEKNKLVFKSYYKMPAAQTSLENCVAHNGSLIPIPGREIMVQGWYQGGISVFDWTDVAKPKEIAYFDRGPIDATRMITGGSWSVYWYNGLIVSSEIARGLDIFELLPSGLITQNEIDAAKTVQLRLPERAGAAEAGVAGELRQGARLSRSAGALERPRRGASRVGAQRARRGREALGASRSRRRSRSWRPSSTPMPEVASDQPKARMLDRRGARAHDWPSNPGARDARRSDGQTMAGIAAKVRGVATTLDPAYNVDRNTISASRFVRGIVRKRSRARAASPPCHRMASSTDAARPSCSRPTGPPTVCSSPNPHNGGVRHSRPDATPSPISSARSAPMS